MSTYQQVEGDNVPGSHMRVTPLALYLTQQLYFVEVDDLSSGDTATDLQPIGNSALLDFFTSTDAVPQTGSLHPYYANTCVMDLDISAMPGDTGPSANSVKVDITWLQILVDSNGFPEKETEITPCQTQEISNFDFAGNVTNVLYTINAPGIGPLNLVPFPIDLQPGAPATPPVRVADINVPRIFYSVRIGQFENLSGDAIGDLCYGLQTDDLNLPVYNTDDWLGFPANTLLYLGASTDYRGIPIAKRVHNFITNDRGWNKFIAVYQQQNGLTPIELQDFPSNKPQLDPATSAAQLTALGLNGIGIFNMLQSTKFSVLFANVIGNDLID